MLSFCYKLKKRQEKTQAFFLFFFFVYVKRQSKLLNKYTTERNYAQQVYYSKDGDLGT